MTIRAWTIVADTRSPRFWSNGLPELFSTRAMADSQNIGRLNGDKVIRVEIREIRTNNRRGVCKKRKK